MCADVLLLFLADRVGARRLACIAAALACAGLLAYGSAPLWSAAGRLYALARRGDGALCLCGRACSRWCSPTRRIPFRRAAALLSAPCTPCTRGSQAALCLFLLVWFALFGLESWNGAVLTLAALPAAAFALLLRAPLPRRAREAPPRAAFRPFYIFALCAVFFGYGAEVVMNQWIAAFVSESLGSVAGGLLGCALFALCLGAGGTLYVRRAPHLLSRAHRRRPRRRGGVRRRGALGRSPRPLLRGGLRPVRRVSDPRRHGGGERAFLPRTGGWMLASLAVAQDAGGAALPALAGALAGEGSLRTSFLALWRPRPRRRRSPSPVWRASVPAPSGGEERALGRKFRFAPPVLMVKRAPIWYNDRKIAA